MASAKDSKNWVADGVTTSLIEVDADSATKEEIGEFIVEQIMQYVGDKKSPVTNQRFQQLSKKYAKFKSEQGASPVPDLELDGDMLQALTYRVRRDGVEVGIFRGKEAAKADGHNNFSGKSQIPTRQFLPDKGESFIFDDEIEQMIADSVFEDVSALEVEESLEVVETEAEFFAAIRDLTGIDDKTTIKKAIISTPVIFERVKKLGLAKFVKLKR